MKYLNHNTLAYFDAAPQRHAVSLDSWQVSVLSKATKQYRQHCGLVVPQDEALIFYAQNHCASIVRKQFTKNEVLPQWAQDVMKTYTATVAEQGLRLVHYVASIVTREMRHLKTGTNQSHAAFWNEIDTKTGNTAVKSFIQWVKSDGDEDVAVGKYMDHPPVATLEQLLVGYSYAYHNGAWSGGYGSAAWGKVTDALLAWVRGQISLEMFVDTAYTLEHNNGNIFNKEMMYSSPDQNKLTTVLDVQRTGQIPDLILDSQGWGINKVAAAKSLVQLIATHVPGVFKGYVDWVAVEAARPAEAKQKHPHAYSAQLTQQQAAKPKPVPAVKIFGKKALPVGTFDVLPGQSVTLYERVKGKAA